MGAVVEVAHDSEHWPFDEPSPTLLLLILSPAVSATQWQARQSPALSLICMFLPESHQSSGWEIGLDGPTFK